MTEWVVSPHARERMEERGIAEDQLDALLAKPGVTLPDTKRSGRRIYSNDVMIAVIDEQAHEVVTVGYKGASRNDWEAFPAPQGGAAPVEPVQFRQRRKRVKEKRLPTKVTSVLDGVHPAVADGVRAYLAEHGLDFRAIRVDSPTEVTITPPFKDVGFLPEHPPT